MEILLEREKEYIEELESDSDNFYNFDNEITEDNNIYKTLSINNGNYETILSIAEIKNKLKKRMYIELFLINIPNEDIDIFEVLQEYLKFCDIERVSFEKREVNSIPSYLGYMYEIKSYDLRDLVIKDKKIPYNISILDNIHLPENLEEKIMNEFKEYKNFSSKYIKKKDGKYYIKAQTNEEIIEKEKEKERMRMKEIAIIQETNTRYAIHTMYKDELKLYNDVYSRFLESYEEKYYKYFEKIESCDTIKEIIHYFYDIIVCVILEDKLKDEFCNKYNRMINTLKDHINDHIKHHKLVDIPLGEVNNGLQLSELDIDILHNTLKIFIILLHEDNDEIIDIIKLSVIDTIKGSISAYEGTEKSLNKHSVNVNNLSCMEGIIERIYKEFITAIKDKEKIYDENKKDATIRNTMDMLENTKFYTLIKPLIKRNKENKQQIKFKEVDLNIKNIDDYMSTWMRESKEKKINHLSVYEKRELYFSKLFEIIYEIIKNGDLPNFYGIDEKITYIITNPFFVYFIIYHSFNNNLKNNIDKAEEVLDIYYGGKRKNKLKKVNKKLHKSKKVNKKIHKSRKINNKK